jgi:hypothetical protein
VAERFSIDAQVRAIQAVYDEELSRARLTAALPLPSPSSAPAPGSGSRRRPAERATLEVPPL